MTISLYLEKVDVKNDLKNIDNIYGSSYSIMFYEGSLEKYRRNYRLKGKIHSEKRENTLQINVSLKDYHVKMTSL